MNPTPAAPTTQMQFRRPWRAYQERVLAAVNEHLSDRRLHVVAAPGAGKTTLGIEIFRLIGRPALVLAPTRTIRDQWIVRLKDFLPDQSIPNWAGSSLEEQTFFTAVTYQALHTKFRRSEQETDTEGDTDSAADAAPDQSELQALIARCRQLGVGTVILDEAHHLRQEWWRALSAFLQGLDQPILVSLTATPPYDVVSLEWHRYEELCGPIDEEISIPELVRAGTLCPHQDFVWACPPSEKDVITARQHDAAVQRFMGDILVDRQLPEAVKRHSWLTQPHPDAEAVLDDPEFAVSLLVLLKSHQAEPPEALLKLIDCSWTEVPAPTPRWWSVLLKRYLFTDEWPEECAQHRTDLARRLRQDGLLFRHDLRLTRHIGLQTAFSQSSAKIEACLEIHRLERRIRGDKLRQVVLTDFIRDREIDRLGAWPVFRRLVESEPVSAAGVVLLTGKVALVHGALFKELASEEPALAGTPDRDLPHFIRVTSSPLLTGQLTRALAAGRLHTMVGTRSLLGEGWDCPAVNSLVLASYVGAFVATNQMRGRAIRVDPATPDKVASIWHIVALEPGTPSGLGDLEQLTEKFETFAGLHHSRPMIESGLTRLELGELKNQRQLDVWNEESSRRAAAVDALGPRWQAAVEFATEHRVVAAVDATALPAQRSFVYSNTLRYLLYCAFWSFVGGTGGALRSIRLRQLLETENLRWIVIFAALVGLAFSLPKLLKFAWIALRHAPIDGSIRQIGWTLLDALVDANLITTARRRLDLRCVEFAPGQFSLSLTGGTYYESSLFADSLNTLLGPIENPRYLISREGTLPWMLSRKDYHALPAPLAAKKELAEQFQRHWRRRVGSGDVIFTRSPEGRRALLQARIRALSTAFTEKSRRRDRWC